MAAAVSTLSDRFKAYLQEEFHKITPTKAAMEFRKKLLVEMLDREQELKIKGVTDDELIFKLVVEGLGDLPARLDEFIDIGKTNRNHINTYLDKILENVEFNMWYFGKRHINKLIPPRYQCLFDAVEFADKQRLPKPKKVKKEKNNG